MKLLDGRRILLVEDEFLVAASIEDALVEVGCVSIGPASRVAQALRLLEEHTVDAAVLDLNLTGETSEGVAAVLRERAIPFVMTTGYGPNDRVSCLGAHAILDKPYTPEALISALAALFK